MKTVIATLLALGWSGLALSQASSAQRPSGKTVELVVPSTTYPQGRHAWVYTPLGYPGSCHDECNLIVALDGAIYATAMAMPDMLDSLIALGRTRPAVAVLIDNGGPPGRIQDLANSARFAGFVANEMVPWARAHYRVTRSPAQTLITGSSAGGLGAAYIAMTYPGVFGNVLSQSGAFWRGNEASNDPPYEWLTQQFSAMPAVSVRFFLDVGAREAGGALAGAAPSLLSANRHLDSVLKVKGYRVDYFEVPNGEHSPDTWRPRLPVGIVRLLPGDR